VSAEALAKLESYPHVVLSWVGDDGYPVQTPAHFKVDGERGVVRIKRTGVDVPGDRRVNLIASHIRPQPGVGYDERRYVVLWGTVADEGGETVLTPDRSWGWDEAETPFFEYVERSNSRALRYMRSLSIETGREIRPRLSRLWTFLIATRFPFLTATLVPVLLGIAVAARDGEFTFWLAVLTVIGAAAIHLGLNTANDIFDALSGADDANYNPTQYSGGSRVLQRGLLSLRQMSAICAASYAVGAGIGIFLVVYLESIELLAIGIAGVLLSFFYTAPPLRLVHRGLGELTTALGFGPIMVLGAYVVQMERLGWEPLVASIPVAILVAMILYVNEIPDRRSDFEAGKRTLPTRLSREAVTKGFLAAVLTAFAVVAVASVTGVIPRPAIIALAALPLAIQVYRGINAYYTSPYELMATMGKNVQLHLAVGVLLFAGYMLAVAVGELFDSPPSLLT
jgi:1,4-dihydroxy-2-naphthoate octaprenyltransferase